MTPSPNEAVKDRVSTHATLALHDAPDGSWNLSARTHSANNWILLAVERSKNVPDLADLS